MRLSALEAAFLYMESPTTPMHVGSVSIYEGQLWRDQRGDLDLGRLRCYVRDRLAGIPTLRRHPVWPAGPAGRPRWVEDPDFHISRHVRSMRVADPGSDEQLFSAAEDLLMSLLDRSHPLWELWFVDGLRDGRVAVVEKIHHALVDGIGGVDLAIMLLDYEPFPARPDIADAAAPTRVPSRIELLSSTVTEAVTGPPELALRTIDAFAHPMRSARSARNLAKAIAAVSRPQGGGDIRAPRVFINERVGTKRSYQVVRRSLGETRDTAHALGGTINDVILSAVAGGFGSFMTRRGDDVETIRVLVPISQRAAHEHELLGNRVTGMVVPLPVAPMQPLERFQAARDGARWARNTGEGELASRLLQLSEYLPEPFVAGISRLIHHQPFINLVVTNVPGPTNALYLMGGRMLEAFPVVPLVGNLTLSIGILSYLDQLTIGLWGDRASFPDLNVLAGEIDRGFDDLEATCHTREPSNHDEKRPTPESPSERIRHRPMGHRSRPEPAVHRNGGDVARPTAALRRSAPANRGMHRVVSPPAPASS